MQDWFRVKSLRKESIFSSHDDSFSSLLFFYWFIGFPWVDFCFPYTYQEALLHLSWLSISRHVDGFLLIPNHWCFPLRLRNSYTHSVVILFCFVFFPCVCTCICVVTLYRFSLSFCSHLRTFLRVFCQNVQT